jgi:methylthioribulose-1-phosphate dehydratase
MNSETQDHRSALARAGQAIHARGWVPATSGNFSIRLPSGHVSITASGKDKGSLSPHDIMEIDLEGVPQGLGNPSAETALHLQLYRRDAHIGAVLHTHSLNDTLVSMAAADRVRIEGLELLKALSGIDTHETALDIPVFRNTQNMNQLAEDVEKYMCANKQGHAYLIRGHGLYTWGKDLVEALQHLEALEFLLECHRLRPAVSTELEDQHMGSEDE